MASLLKFRSMFSSRENSLADQLAHLPSIREQWAVTVGCFWFAAGLFVDGWAHNHLQVIDTFFTPWHAIFYSGFLVTAGILLGATWLRMRKNTSSFLQSIPLGYGWSLVGAAIFLVGGIGDMAWHQIFGVEANLEALLSPTHLILAVGFLLMVSSNLRAWFFDAPDIGKPSLALQLPMLLSLSLTLSMLTFMTQYAHFILPRAGWVLEDSGLRDLHQSLAVTGFLFHTILLLGAALFILRRSRIAVGGFTILFTLNVAAMAFMRDGFAFIVAAFIAGMVADMLAPRVHPFEQHRRELRIFSFVVPAVLFAAYFLMMELTYRIAWSVHLWTGCIFITGVMGILVSYLLLPMKEVEGVG